MAKMKVGDRVKRSDATEDSIPAYRDMRGTVTGFSHQLVLVVWDCDKQVGISRPSAEPLAWLVLAEDKS
jgi:hypothetical protein